MNITTLKNDIVAWIKQYFEDNGSSKTRAIVGVSGGVDSSVTSALLVEALGKERVLGVLMPCGNQHDIDIARALVKHLGITSMEINIEDIYHQYIKDQETALAGFDNINVERMKINTQARIRANLLYNISDAVGCRVANTSNLSEDVVGYNTKFGDTVGDFAPLMDLTKTQVVALAHELGLPEVIANKTPEDGLSGQTDEEKLGFSYEVLDSFINDPESVSKEMADKFKSMQAYSKHKILPPVIFKAR